MNITTKRRYYIELAKYNLRKKKNNFFLRDWKLIEGYVEVLKPIFETIKALSQEKIPTLSMVNPILLTIVTKLKKRNNKNSYLVSGVKFARSVCKSMSLSSTSFVQ